MKRLLLFTVFVLMGAAFVLALSRPAVWGFGEIAGSCETDCQKCHKLQKEEAASILRGLNPNAEVLDVRLSPVRGLWEIAFALQGKKGVLYLDFSKGNIIQGGIIKIESKEDLTAQRLQELSKIDPASIPLEGALVMGKKDAKYSVIVFTDPDCPYCKRLHQEIKKVLEKRDDIAFYLKLYPLVNLHPAAYEKAKAVSCEKSVKLLEDAMNGKSLPKASCEDKEVDATIKLAAELGISSTPTIIVPDGTVIGGFVEADALIKLVVK